MSCITLLHPTSLTVSNAGKKNVKKRVFYVIMKGDGGRPSSSFLARGATRETEGGSRSNKRDKSKRS